MKHDLSSVLMGDTAEAWQRTRAGLIRDREGSPIWSWRGEAEGQCRVLLRLETQTGSRLCLPHAQMTCESCSQWPVSDNRWEAGAWGCGMMSALPMMTVHTAEVFCCVADCDAYLLCLENEMRWWVDSPSLQRLRQRILIEPGIPCFPSSLPNFAKLTRQEGRAAKFFWL